MEKGRKVKVYEFICPACGKSVTSLVESQAKFNFDVHIKTCKEMKNERERKNKIQ